MKKWKGNLVFMNNGGDEPLKGEMSDVNVWDRTLQEEEVEAFHQCEPLEGNVVSWRSASLNIVNLDQSRLINPKFVTSLLSDTNLS